MKRKSIIGGVVSFALLVIGVTPSQATSPVTLENSNCDFSAVSQGLGSINNPFIINSGLDIQEMPECYARTKTISSSVVNNDGTVTFTVEVAHGAYGVGQVIEISGTDDASFDTDVAKVVSATSGTVTISSSATVGMATSSGLIIPVRNYFKLGGDINLGALSTQTWNNNGSISITAATKSSDNTITFTAANTLAVGENLFIDGMGDNTFNIGHATVSSATSTEFVVSTNYPMADGAASAAGGTAYFEGWMPVALTNSDLDGDNHTISGITIHRSAAVQGLFGRVENANIRNLNITNSVVNTTTNEAWSNSRTGVFASDIQNSILENLTIESSSVVSGGNYGGLIAGIMNNVALSDISVAGDVGVSAKVAISSRRGYSFGGFAGEGVGITLTNATTSATVDLTLRAQDRNFPAEDIPLVHLAFNNGGGFFGDAQEFLVRNVSSSSNVTGSGYIGSAFGEMDYDGQIVNASATGDVVALSIAGTNLDVDYVGGFAGRLQGDSDNVNITSSGSVTVTVPSGSSADVQYIGGLAGEAKCCGNNTQLNSSGPVVINNLGSGDVSEVGGMMGENDCCQIISHSDSSSSVTITSASGDVFSVGGFVGEWTCCGGDRQNTSSGDVTVLITDTSDNWAYDIGGYVGRSEGEGVMSHIHSSGNVSVSNGYRVGGFAGTLGSKASYHDIVVTGNVSATHADHPDASNSNRDNYANVGGFAGYTEGRTLIERVAVTNEVSVTALRSGTPANVGGLLGGTSTDLGPVEIIDSYFIGSVSGGNYVAGMLGRAASVQPYRIQGNLIVATVTASAVGATVDPVMNGYFQDPSGTNFFDSTVAGTTQNFPLFNAETTSNLKLAATYTSKGWDLTGVNAPWRIDATTNGGYPYLVVPPNDDNRTEAGGTTTTVTNTIVQRTSPPSQSPIVYSSIKSVTFSGKSSVLTRAHRKALNVVARTIAASDSSVFVISASPRPANLRVTNARIARVHAHLVSALKRLKSNKEISIMVTPTTSNPSKAIRIQQAK